MKIGEIAKAAGVTTSRIRFYEKRGIIAPAARGANGYRDYPEELVALLRFIEQAQGLGFTLREIASVEVRSGPHPISCDEAIRLLSAKRDAVDALIAEAKERMRKIDTLIGELRENQESPKE
ncbi:MerR family transcriptional regulator [Paracoccus versutus]|uniref:MerR family transcriptional regulator n=1 Tax=Paracoccus versutus TaxID=34007 RepID=A0AAQ0HHC2_PARVE|nr:MerR family transcriptional regulator [Paracoccus versutus]KGJ07601.1 MerR family transcriptional regulator [Paracoccus versutus]REG45847.1 MerR family transcriptional regulator [Paracoccus versutus]WEJ77706.1 MerR family transcriptional regulator [Paracoccus versutus]